jgi:DNA topoisomerase-1
MTPDELTLEAALKLLAAPKGTDPIGEIGGLPLFVKSGRYGAYVQWGTHEAPPPGLDKPKMASLFKTMDPAHITLPDATRLLSLPRVVGVDPADGVAITAQNGRYGPYITKGKDSRTLAGEEQLFDITVEQALALLATPRQFGRRAAQRPPLREFANDPVSGKPVLAKEGKFGLYVTDGETNASLTRSDRLEEMIPERAYELLAIRRENAGNGTGRKKRTPAKKTARKPSRKEASSASGSPAKSGPDKPERIRSKSVSPKERKVRKAI